MSKLWSRLTYANVMATVAVFIALGGGAYAALKLPAGSVGTKQLKDDAVKSSKVAKGSLLANDFKAGQLPRGAQGIQGPKGEQGAKGDTGPSTGAAGGDLAGTYPDPTIRGSEPWHEVGSASAVDCSTSPGNFCRQSHNVNEWRSRPNDAGEDFNSVGFYRDRSGVVRLKGRARCRDICNSGAAYPIFYLPPGYRPPHTEKFLTFLSSGSTSFLTVYSTGKVEAPDPDGASDYISLDGFSLRCGPAGSDGCP